MSWQRDERPGQTTYACAACGTSISPLSPTCKTCDSPNPPNRHVRAAVAPIFAVLRWAQRRRPGLPRAGATLAGAVILVYPFGPLIVSWWLIVAFWWFLSFIGPWYRVALLVGAPVGMFGVGVLEQAGFDCSEPLACMAGALGLSGGPVTPASIAGVLLLLVGTTITILAAVRAGRSE